MKKDRKIACCAFGHRLLLMDVEKSLWEALEWLVKEQGVTVFYTGGMGEFDALFSRTVRALRRDNPYIRLVMVLPYLTQRLNADKAYYETQYDEILIPAVLDGVHPKAAIALRNRWIVDHSDFVVTAIQRDYGGAAEAVKYAKVHGKVVIDCTG